MSSLRLEIEQAMGLRFPERNGEAMVRFEETMEVPRTAEALMRGLYRDPDLVRKGFQTLHQETATVLDILLPRRVRLRDWTEELPERPKEAEEFLRETSEQIQKQERRRIQAERDLLTKLQESTLDDLFPIPLSAFAVVSYNDPSVRMFLKPLGRLAEVLQLNPDQLRQAVRLHFLFMLLLISGTDLDGHTYIRGNEEPVVHLLSMAYTLKQLRKQSEVLHSYNEWTKAWGGKNPPQSILADNSSEKLRAAMVFWRRQQSIKWEDCWNIVNQLEERDTFRFDSFSASRPIS